LHRGAPAASGVPRLEQRPSGADGFGTHDWVLKEANRLAATRDAG